MYLTSDLCSLFFTVIRRRFITFLNYAHVVVLGVEHIALPLPYSPHPVPIIRSIQLQVHVVLFIVPAS